MREPEKWHRYRLAAAKTTLELVFLHGVHRPDYLRLRQNGIFIMRKVLAEAQIALTPSPRYGWAIGLE